MATSQPVGGTGRQCRKGKGGKTAGEEQDIGQHGTLLGLVCPKDAAWARKRSMRKTSKRVSFA
jgi:hypothetical protein